MRLLGLIFLFASAVSADKILALVPFPSRSHFIMFEIVVKELLERGHEVTSIGSFRYKQKHENLTEIVIEPGYDFSEEFPTLTNIFDMRFNSPWRILSTYWNMGLESTEYALSSAVVKAFISRNDLKFDLILSEQFFQESMLMFAHKFNAPIVTLNTLGHPDYIDRAMGVLTPYSIVPNKALADYTDDMDFLQRCYNLMFSLYDVLYRHFVYMPKMEDMARRHFGSLGNLPRVADLEQSISILLVNSHNALSYPRPLMPNMINIGGLHIKPPKPLPNDIQEFLDSADHGAIFMSLGSYIQSSKMPQEKLEAIFKVFGSLKQKVLWKFESEDLTGLPKNVKVSKWFPQSDILAHPNVVLFISHGGAFGTSEASHRGVPILFIPFFSDQYKNAKLTESLGYGKKLLFSDLNERNFKLKIREMIEIESFSKNAKKVSKLLNDNPQKPLDVAIYWIEYVIRHNGSEHLKSSAIKMPWFKFLMLDILCAFIAVIGFSWILMKRILRLIFGGSEGGRGKEKIN